MSEPAKRHKPTELGRDSWHMSPVLSLGSLSRLVFPGISFRLVSLGLRLLHGLRCKPAKNSPVVHGFLFHHHFEKTICQNGESLAALLEAGVFRNPMQNLGSAF